MRRAGGGCGSGGAAVASRGEETGAASTLSVPRCVRAERYGLSRTVVALLSCVRNPQSPAHALYSLDSCTARALFDKILSPLLTHSARGNAPAQRAKPGAKCLPAPGPRRSAPDALDLDLELASAAAAGAEAALSAERTSAKSLAAQLAAAQADAAAARSDAAQAAQRADCAAAERDAAQAALFIARLWLRALLLALAVAFMRRLRLL